MLMPGIFGKDLFDDFMDSPFTGFNTNPMMRTDVKEMDHSYELAIDMPGFQKEDMKAELKEGYLTISAVSRRDNDEKDKKGRFIRRERYYGSCSRSFYVGEDVKQEEITARFENGILKLTVPKKEDTKAVEENHYIAIEG